MESANSTAASEDDLFQFKLAAARAGCQQSLGELLAPLQAYLLTLAAQNWQAGSATEQYPSDLVQTTNLDAIRDFRMFRGQTPGEFLAWIKKIMHYNRVAEWRRIKTRRINREIDLSAWGGLIERENDPEQFEPSPSGQVVSNERDLLLGRIMDQLPDRYRQVIVMHHFHGVTFEEITRQFGCSADAVRKIWGRALPFLGRRVKNLL